MSQAAMVPAGGFCEITCKAGTVFEGWYVTDPTANPAALSVGSAPVRLRPFVMLAPDHIRYRRSDRPARRNNQVNRIQERGLGVCRRILRDDEAVWNRCGRFSRDGTRRNS